MIANKYEHFANRYIVPRYKKMKEHESNHLTNVKKEIEYEYYICDFCRKEIKIQKKLYEQTGGIVVIPAIITKKQAIKLALCNGCLNKVLAEFEGRSAS